MVDLVKSARRIQGFKGGSLKTQISNLEHESIGKDTKKIQALCSENMINDNLLHSAIAIKKASNQIHEVIHAIGIMLLLPRILQRGERIKYLSLAAGNTGKKFDLKTNKRIAEFKFMDWKGGAETARKYSLFKDFFFLAEEKKSKNRYLYVLGLDYPLQFLNSDKSISSILNRNAKLLKKFRKLYRFTEVKEYYDHRKKRVKIIDINEIMPSLARHLQ
jgi:ribosomal protein L35